METQYSAEIDFAEGLSRVIGCDKADRLADVVFVHGLGGDAAHTWQSGNDADSFWPRWLGQDFPEIGIWTLGYAASASAWQAQSMPLADRGNAVLEQLYAEGLGKRPLVFITHSMGGIVVKQLLRHADSFGVKRWEEIAQATRSVIFIATPHSGANSASFVNFFHLLLRTNENISELQAHHPRLRELHGWFLNFYNKRELTCRTYCETREVRPSVLGLSLPKGILIVDQTAAEPNIPGERAIPLDEDHISICKPHSRQADLYKSLKKCLEDTLQRHKNPN
jgi:pimeloyl-ACP methyl ester carboxylesterase